MSKVKKQREYDSLLIQYAKEMAKKYYDERTYAHAERVAKYVQENRMIKRVKMNDCIALAWMHDLLEDTEYRIPEKGILEFRSHFVECLHLITKEKDMDYIDYIKRIKEMSYECDLAYWVKLADIKDHLMQMETLTDRLKEKYLKALPYLL